MLCLSKLLIGSALLAMVLPLGRSDTGAFTSSEASEIRFQANLDLTDKWAKAFVLNEGQTFEVSARLLYLLNCRNMVEWP